MSRAVRILLISLALLSALLLFPRLVGKHSYRREMALVKAIAGIHATQIGFIAEHGHYASTLAELGQPGRVGDFRIEIRPAVESYELIVTGPHGWYRRFDPALADPLLAATGKSQQ